MVDAEVIASYQERAKEDVVSARVMLQNHFYPAAVSRAYYAVFYGITALLLAMDIKPKTHKQLGIEFRKHFIRTGIIEAEYSGLLSRLTKARQRADYVASPDLTIEQVNTMVDQSEAFVEVLLNHTPGR